LIRATLRSAPAFSSILVLLVVLRHLMALAGAVTQQALCNRSRAGRAHGFLASDAAVAGIALPVDGGWNAH